jgi:hypothetical protein
VNIISSLHSAINAFFYIGQTKVCSGAGSGEGHLSSDVLAHWGSWDRQTDGQVNTTGTVVQERGERDCSTSRPHLDRVPHPRHSSGPFANGERNMYDLYESTVHYVPERIDIV